MAAGIKHKLFRMKVVTIDGNIGAGKTTVLEYLKSAYGFGIDIEPVDKWQPWLNRMYTSGKDVFEFQIRVWLDRCWPALNNTSSITCMERSPLFQERVFIPANVSNGILSDTQADLVTEMYKKIYDIWEPDVYVYLRSDPAKCAERIMRRGRESEDSIRLHYLHQLHDLHESTVAHAKVLNKRIVVVDMEGKTTREIGDEIMTACTV